MSAQTMETILVWMINVSAVVVTLFPVTYAVAARWYGSHAGRAVMGWSFSTALLIDLTWYFYHYPPTSLPVIFWLSVFAWLNAIVAAIYSVTVVIGAQVISAQEGLPGQDVEPTH